MKAFLFLFIPFITACSLSNEAPVKNGTTEKTDTLKAEISEVIRLFRDTSFTTLHVHAYESWPDDLEDTSRLAAGTIDHRENLLFKGRKIEDTHASLVALPEIEQYYDLDYHALWKFKLNEKHKGCLIRIVTPYGPHIVNGIWLYVLDTSGRAFVNKMEIARNIGEEQFFSNMQSWIKDLDKDGTLDVLTRTRNEEAGNTGLALDLSDTITAVLMKGTKWIDWRINDINRARKDHPMWSFYPNH